MEAALILGAAIVALVAGVMLGWLLGRQPIAALQKEAADLRDCRVTAERELALAAEQARRLPQTEEMLRLVTEERDEARQKVASLAPVAERAAAQEQELATVRAEKEQLAAAKAAFERGEAERQRAFAEQLSQVKELETKLEARFGELAGKAVETAHDAFLKRASERLGTESKEHHAKLQNLLGPVEQTLKRYEEGLQRVEKERVDHYAGLREAVELVRTGQGQVRDEARRLVTALTSSPKQRGRWGEKSLENVLTQAGLVKNVDFRMEVSVDGGEEGRLRPDAVVNLPEGRKLIIDAKCSLNAYLDACDEVDDDKRAVCFRAHLASIVRHAQQLGSKNYWAQFGESAEFVVMYIPGEHFLSAALEQDPELWEKAFKDKVLLATPTNLVAIARTVASVWRQERLQGQAEEIAALGKELHSRLATMADHVARMGRNLATVNSAYNQMVGSFESQVFTQARRFETLGAGSAKEIAAPAPVDAAPRPLTKLAPPLPELPEAAE
ncbi:DNA recombination protein RmuC [Sphingomonas sp. BN140010]|uniref:DNA recombination protein RmuC homolog n=1 Tax=Sphingomonas arvum TaxID=2992113 RepID=A0ABT3JI82_9SPHN|nr:DNA recombination protein RmuC [Sphingomonas sp. BN140010]MCW3798801.1 DNA recombination protein RmuC [Sphingomonas sp. BN140010]